MNAPEPQAELRALRNELVLLRLLANNVPVAIAYYEAECTLCRFANGSYAQMFGHDEASIIGRSTAEVIGEDALRAIQPYIDRVLSERLTAAYERELIDENGAKRCIEVSLVPHLEGAGSGDSGGPTQPLPPAEVIGVFVLINDITRHRRAEAALRESEERLAMFMHASAEGIVIHKGGVITDVNPPLLALLGYQMHEMMGRQTIDYVAPDHRERVIEVIRSGQEMSYDSEVLHRHGHRIPVEFIVRTLQHQDERLRLTIVRDRRDRLAAQARIHHLAHHDTLTGLPNRQSFIDRLQVLIARAQQYDDTLALLFIDLDHFKRVNDSLGHPVGDRLLQTVASRITSQLRSGDLVARFGGDEFVLLLAGSPERDAVSEVAHKLLDAISAPLQVQGVSISVTPSIGVAMYPDDGHSPDELIKHADTAMYRAKGQGRARLRFFEAAMAHEANADLAMEGRLAQAIAAGEFVLHYQPQLALDSGALVGVEALVRWADPQRGLVDPNEFIPLAEAHRLILPIGQWVLREALRQVVAWRGCGLLDVPVAVNLSTQQFRAPGFVETVELALAEEGAQGSQLELELTERMLMDDLPAVRETLLRLKGLGVGVAVDDFGTGYTSLAHLKELPIDCLKIDSSFVKDLPGDRGSAAIASAIIEMAHQLGMRVVAEGIEHAAQREWMRDQGCDVQQGFLEAPPMALAVFEAWLRARRG